jgi:hypothetical protein
MKKGSKGALNRTSTPNMIDVNPVIKAIKKTK